MNTAIFSLVHDLFLRGLPFEGSSRIIRVYGEAKERNLQQLPFSIPRYWHYRDAQTVFSETAADTERDSFSAAWATRFNSMATMLPRIIFICSE